MSSEAKNTDDLTSEIEKMRKEQNDCESELEKRLKMIQNFIENQAPEVKQNFELYEEKLIEETQAKSELQILSKVSFFLTGKIVPRILRVTDHVER